MIDTSAQSGRSADNVHDLSSHVTNIHVGLFIPCYIDQFYPQVGMATVAVLEHCGVQIEYPQEQTCCGQLMANIGCTSETRPVAEHFLEVFGRYPYVVAPSASCVAMIRNHYSPYLTGQSGFEELQAKTFELCEFLVDVVKLKQVPGSFPYRVGLHQGCHGLRELRLGPCSELRQHYLDKPRKLLETLQDIHLPELGRQDECCGFGGTFAILEEALSRRMGLDRIADHEQAEVDVITSCDMSCLMHLEGLIRRHGKDIGVMHIAEILAGHGIPQRSAVS